MAVVETAKVRLLGVLGRVRHHLTVLALLGGVRGMATLAEDMRLFLRRQG
jgi:hypothetical protein